jgi:hypothetical protein
MTKEYLKTQVEYGVVCLFTIFILALRWQFVTLRRGRTGVQFLRDCTKIILGATCAHMLNVWLDSFPVAVAGLKGLQGDECQLYAAQVIASSTVGTIFVFMVFTTTISLMDCVGPRCKTFSKLLVRTARKHAIDINGRSLENKAEFLTRRGYSQKYASVKWYIFLFLQLPYWLFIVCTAKCIVIPCVLYFYKAFGPTVWLSWVTSPWYAVVLIATPFNMIQFWLQDEILAHDWTSAHSASDDDKLMHIAEIDERGLDEVREENKKLKKMIQGNKMDAAVEKMKLNSQIYKQMLTAAVDVEMQMKFPDLDDQKGFAEVAQPHYEALLRDTQAMSKTMETKVKEVNAKLAKVPKRAAPPPQRASGCSKCTLQ